MSALELYIGAAATIFLAIATVLAAVIQAKDKKKQAVRDTSAPPPRETAVEPMESTAPDEPANGNSAYLRSEGDEYARMKQWKKAAKKYRAATELEPDSALNHDKLAGMLCRLGKYDEALEENIKAVARASDAAEKAQCYAHKADTLWELARTADALADIQEAIKLVPDDAEYYGDLGDCLSKQGQYEKAAKAFRKAAERAPDNPEYYYDLGNCLRMLKRSEEAVEAFRKAVNLAPNNPFYKTNLSLFEAILRASRTPAP